MPQYKNCFGSPGYVEHIILDEKRATLGTLRIKPSSILWKGKHDRQFYTVPLESFMEWIKSPASLSRRTKS